MFPVSVGPPASILATTAARTVPKLSESRYLREFQRPCSRTHCWSRVTVMLASCDVP